MGAHRLIVPELGKVRHHTSHHQPTELPTYRAANLVLAMDTTMADRAATLRQLVITPPTPPRCTLSSSPTSSVRIAPSTSGRTSRGLTLPLPLPVPLTLCPDPHRCPLPLPRFLSPTPIPTPTRPRPRPRPLPLTRYDLKGSTLGRTVGVKALSTKPDALRKDLDLKRQAGHRHPNPINRNLHPSPRPKPAPEPAP